MSSSSVAVFNEYKCPTGIKVSLKTSTLLSVFSDCIVISALLSTNLNLSVFSNTISFTFSIANVLYSSGTLPSNATVKESYLILGLWNVMRVLTVLKF